MCDDITLEQRLLRAIFGAPCDGTPECPAPLHQFPCQAHEPSNPPAEPEWDEACLHDYLTVEQDGTRRCCDCWGVIPAPINPPAEPDGGGA